MVFLGGDIEFHLFYLEDFIGKILEFAFRFRFGLLAGCEDETDKVLNNEKSKLFHNETFSVIQQYGSLTNPGSESALLL